MSGMLTLDEMAAEAYGLPRPRRTPSQLTDDAYRGVDKLAIKLPPSEFLSAPVTKWDRAALGLAPRGMLHNLNKQALDRELDAILKAVAYQRSKLIPM